MRRGGHPCLGFVDRLSSDRYISVMKMLSYDSIVLWFLYFSVTAFLGWVAESGYRTIEERRPVNSGFLTGPFIPIYGFGALAIAALSRAIPREWAVLYWGILALSPSIVEYLTSWLFERLFGLRLWDYSDKPFNLKGRIGLLFSFYWACLTVFTVLFLEPFLLGLIASTGERLKYFFAGALSMNFFIDTVISSRAIMYFKRFIIELRELAMQGGSFRPLLKENDERLPNEIRRLLKPLKAFPNLVRELKPTITAIPEWIRAKMESMIGGKHFR